MLNIFQECSSLTSVTIPNSVTSIGWNAFSYCSGMTSVTVPNSVTSIGDYAFSYCSGMTSVTVPNSMTSIGDGAFRGCTGLTSVIIPNSVTSIGSSAFSGCSLTEVYSMIEEPFAITDYTFIYWDNDKGKSVFTSATLYVPAGTKSKYEATDGWKSFSKIVEMEPVVKELTAESAEVIVGLTADINIGLNNSMTDFTAYQLDLVLPEGLSLVLDSDGKPAGWQTGRYTDVQQQLTLEQTAAGTYRFACYSLTNAAISGTEGALLHLQLQAAAGMAAGDYTVKVTNAVFSRSNGEKVQVDDKTFTVTVKAVAAGDANGDGVLDVEDVVEMINAIMGHPTEGAPAAATDMNGDGEVDIADIVALINMIISQQGGGNAGVRSMMATDGNGDRLSIDMEQDGRIAVGLDSSEDYVAFQMRVQVPEGAEIERMTLDGVRGQAHRLAYGKCNDGSYVVIGYSLTNSSLPTGNGTLLRIELSGNASGMVTATQAHFVTADVRNIALGDAMLNMTTSINGAALNDKDEMTNDNWYDLNGRKLDGQPTRKGVYIRNGKKHVF